MCCGVLNAKLSVSFTVLLYQTGIEFVFKVQFFIVFITHVGRSLDLF